MSYVESNIDDIFNSSDDVWEMICDWEDGKTIDPARVDALSDGDMKIWIEERAYITDRDDREEMLRRLTKRWNREYALDVARAYQRATAAPYVHAA